MSHDFPSRVAFVSVMEGLPWGGSETLWSRAALQMHRVGAATVAVSVKGWNPKPAGVTSLRVAGLDVTERVGPTRRGRLAAWLAGNADDRWLRRVNPDVVVLSQGHTLGGLDWMARCHRASIPYVVVAQAAGERWWPPDAMADELHRLAAGAALWCFVSEANARLFQDQLGAVLANVRIVRNPFNVPYRTERPTWPDTADGVRLACVARLDVADKGQDLLVRTMALDKWRRRPLTIDLFGTGPHEQGIRRLAALHGVTNVVARGFTSDVPSIWAAHHALVLPSRVEGLPLAAVEAALCDRACVVTDVAGNTELVRDGIDGFVAPSPTVRDLDDALDRMWQRRADLCELGRSAGEHARAIFPPDPVAAFIDLIGGVGRSRGLRHE